MATVAESLPLERNIEEKIARFDIHQILQHILLLVSFTLLVVTGFPLKFHESMISQWWVGVLGGIEVARTIHHFAAYVMVFDCFYHVFYLAYTIVILKRPFPVGIIPSLLDVTTFYQEIMYFLGLRKEKPKFGRFNWREKFDYWAIFWGMPVMVGSGFILMFPVLVTNILPGWTVPVAHVAHSDEALLALSWIVIMHVFFTHLSPGIFPLNTSIFTGKVSHKQYQHEHALEYERIIETTTPEEPAEEQAADITAESV